MSFLGILNIEKCHDKFIRSNIQILLRRALIIGLQDFVLYMTEAKEQLNTQIYTTMSTFTYFCQSCKCPHIRTKDPRNFSGQ